MATDTRVAAEKALPFEVKVPNAVIILARTGSHADLFR